jgi:hypothetical protein
MMTHDEMIAVIQHHKNGGKVEWRYPHTNWEDATDASYWNFREVEYRAKPEPLVLWGIYNKRTNIRASIADIEFVAEEQIQRMRHVSQEAYIIKKFIEEI